MKAEKIFHKKRVTRCGDSEGNFLDRYTQLAIENNAIDDYAEGITDKEYLEMEQLEKQILENQEIVKEVRFLAEIRYDEELFKILDSQKGKSPK
ncbi:MAG: hypothetical protein IIC67_07495 [Thaumarchaeota archaeon]|nr:hypothetical protein [Nitrososphaerota archaeon]